MIMGLASMVSALGSISSLPRCRAFGYKVKYTRCGLTIHTVSNKTEQIHWHLNGNVRKKEPKKFSVERGTECSIHPLDVLSMFSVYHIFPHHPLYSQRTLYWLFIGSPATF